MNSLWLSTIFDRDTAYWWDAVLIQRFKDRIYKYLYLTEDDVRKYVELSDEASKLNIVINKKFNDGNLDIREVNISFNPVDTDVNPACVIDKWVENCAFVYSSQYVGWETLWDFWWFDKPTRQKWDLQDFIASICEYIEKSLVYNLFDKDASFFHQISPVNIKVMGLENGVLSLLVTDIWASIKKMVDWENC